MNEWTVHSRIGIKKNHQLDKAITWARSDFDEEKIPKNIFLQQGLSLLEQKQKCNVLYILTKKFEEFCVEPNLQQILKLDCISPGLRKYFLTKTDKKIKLCGQEEEDLYQVDFEKIINIFPYIREIHFMNWYTLNDHTLQNLIEQINKTDNKLEQIKFLYYDYKDPLKKHPFFFNPKYLTNSLCGNIVDGRGNKWELKYPDIMKNRRDGYRIRIKLPNSFLTVDDPSQLKHLKHSPKHATV